MTAFLALRHRLVPYLHTMNRRAHRDGEPLVQPMYYDHPDDDDAYRVPNQYCFGDRLLVAPITTPADRATGLGSVRAWLPPGRWTDVFTGLVYRGGTTILLHRDLDTIPVLAPAGAILPLAARVTASRTPTPWNCGCTRARTGSSRWPRSGTTSGGRSPGSRCAATSCASTPSTASAGPSRRPAATTWCCAGSPDVTGRRGRRDRAADAPRHRWPAASARPPARSRPGEGAVLRLVGDTAPAGNRDVGERLFALLDAAQIKLATKEAVHRVVTGHDPARAVPALAALDLPRPLFTAVVEAADGVAAGYIRSGAAIPSRPSPSCRVAAASRHSASRLARTSSGAESTGQFS